MPEYVPLTWVADDTLTAPQITTLSADAEDEELTNSVQSARMDLGLATGVNSCVRHLSGGNGTAVAASQTLMLTYFTADKDVTVNNVYTRGGTTAAGATPTIVRFGLYSVAANGDLTLVASTANDTTIFNSASQSVNKALSASYNMVMGQRYAGGWLVVSAAAMPTIIGIDYQLSGTEMALAPRLTGVVTGQSNLPSSVAAASVGSTASRIHYFRLYT